MRRQLSAPKIVSDCCQFKNGDFPARPEDFIVWEVANKHNLYIREIMRHDTRGVLVKARREIAWRLFHELGYGELSIADMLNRCRDTGTKYVREFSDDKTVLDMRGMFRNENR